MTSPTWRFDFLLPNLELPESDPAGGEPQVGEWSSGITLGSEFIAIVPNRDPRLAQARLESARLSMLLDSFRTIGGHDHRPAIIISREDAPERIKLDMECLIAFRNAVAFSFLLRARAAYVGGASYSEPAWSETFELHPTVLGQRGQLVTRSEAVVAVFAPEASYLATHSPHVSPCGRRLYSDAYVYRALSEVWHRRYVGGDSSIFTTALFRALEVAFLAASVANKNQGSLAEYGTQLGLWVSALEILAWPKTQHANLPSVLDLLGQFDWASEKLAEKTRALGKLSNLNVVQYAYVLMYRARNAFLHGNPVSAETLVPPELSQTLSLPRVASTVFRTALAAYLSAEIPRIDFVSDELTSEIMSDYQYARALKVGFGLEQRSPVDA